MSAMINQSVIKLANQFKNKKRLFNTGKVITSFLLVVLSACTQETKQVQLNPLLKDSQNIVSTRPQKLSSSFIAILKLKNPSLMQSSVKQNGKTVIDPIMLKAVLDEQTATLEALAKISSEIKVIYRYKMVLNGFALLVPNEFSDKIKGLGQVASTEKSGNFSMPKTMELSSSQLKPSFLERNSSKFIGAEKLNLEGITGKNVKVGVIDTGIDYTHAMFLGEGTEAAYKAVKPSESNSGFPNQRVVGGIDLVGTDFNSASVDYDKHIPKPDMNPLDEAGHGSHVAGTIAGIGDQVNSYNGMAPDAALHAIKVFGADGSTSDSVVIAALEYSADPNADGDIADQLDIVNLSLGSGYGNPHILYSEAIKNLVHGGTVVVASAGNSGHIDYIVGAPGSSTEAISVAASVDNGDQNWKFNTSKIRLGSSSSETIILVEAIEAATSKKIADAGPIVGQLVPVGIAAEDFSEEQKLALKGKVALIDRGQVNFNDKLKRAAAAGVIGVVVANNKEGAPISMGTTDTFDFPAIMITLADGNKIKAALKNTDANQAIASIEFQSADKIEKPELIDTLTDFTSKGPRSIDGLLKPEISAPGNNVISAKMGGGAVTVQMSGTSMAAPHMAGVMALVKQAQPTLSAEELKSVVMGTATTISEKDERYPITLQGSGRVQAEKAAKSAVVAQEPSISFGELAIESKKVVSQVVHIKNLSKSDIQTKVVFEGNGFMSLQSLDSVLLKAESVTELKLNFTLDASKMKDETFREMDGWVKLVNYTSDNKLNEVYRLPVLAVAHKLSAIKATDLTVQATSKRDASGSIVNLTLKNENQNSGKVLLFNTIALDDRKPSADSYMTAECDLQSVGYKLIQKDNAQGIKEDVLQFAIKTFKPMTTWQSCDVSILIDSNQDGLPEQELLGSSLASIPGQKINSFASTLIDATKAREIRKAFEAELELVKNDPIKLAELKDKEDYEASFIDVRPMDVYNNSTVLVLEMAVSALAKNKQGLLAYKVLLTHNEQSSVEFDDYLKSSSKKSLLLSLKAEDQSFVNLPDTLQLGALEVKNVEFVKGVADGSLLVLLPQNKFTFSDLLTDTQTQVLKPKFRLP